MIELIPMFATIFLLFFSLISADDSPYSECAPETCNGITIKYPFFFPSQYQGGCGYPGFNLTCQHESNILQLDLPNVTLNVMAIDYNSSIVNVNIPKDLMGGDDRCPFPNRNITDADIRGMNSNSLPFNLTKNSTTFYYNCQIQIPNGHMVNNCSNDPHEIPSGNFSSYAFCSGQDDSKGNDMMKCARMVRFPSSKCYGPNDDWSSFVDSGLSLNWNLETSGDCARCTDLDGRCGHNISTGSFVCFHKPNATDSPGNRNKRLAQTTAGVPAAVGLLFISIFLILCFCYFRHRDTEKIIENRSQPQCSDANSVTIFTYKELNQATNGFSPSNEIGGGGCGTVFFGKLCDDREVAVKRLYETNKKRVEQFMNEIKIFSNICHPNLVRLYGCTSFHRKNLFLVYEYINNGTVSDHVHGSRAAKDSLSWKMRLNIAIEAADALAYLHQHEPPIIHRDVKTTNMLLDQNFHVKVADFGFSRLVPTDDVTHVSTKPQGTAGYIDPVYYQYCQLTEKSDVYSFGVVLAELISSLPAVDKTRNQHDVLLANMAIHRIQNQELQEIVDPSFGFESDEWVNRSVSTVAELAFRCLTVERDLRPTMNEVLESLSQIGTGEDEVKN